MPNDASQDASQDAPRQTSKMSSMPMPDMKGMNNDGSAHAMLSMSDREMDMGAHMKMTTLRDLKPGDQEKADQVVAAARAAAEKYTDYKVAWPTGTGFFCPICRRSNITSPTTAMHSRPPFTSILNIPRRCFMRKAATVTS